MQRCVPLAIIQRIFHHLYSALATDGRPLVVARANDKMHQRILQLVGAHQVVNPEQEFGKRFANRLLYHDVIADTNLGDDLMLTEIRIRPAMVGKNLIELELPRRFGVIVGHPPRVPTATYSPEPE